MLGSTGDSNQESGRRNLPRDVRTCGRSIYILFLLDL